ELRVARVHAEQVADIRNVRLEPAHPPHAVLGLGDDFGLAVELLDAEVATQLIHEGQERDRLAERDALPIEPGRVLVLLGELLAELEEQSRLPDAGLARHEDDLPATRPRLAEALAQDLQLVGAPHQGREPTLDRGVETRAPAAGPEDLVSARGRAALDRLFAEI